MSVRPDTFMKMLPSGEWVRCWTRQRDAIHAEQDRYGSIMLWRDEGEEVYRFIPRSSDEFAIRSGTARPG